MDRKTEAGADEEEVKLTEKWKNLVLHSSVALSPVCAHKELVPDLIFCLLLSPSEQLPFPDLHNKNFTYVSVRV